MQITLFKYIVFFYLSLLTLSSMAQSSFTEVNPVREDTLRSAPVKDSVLSVSRLTYRIEAASQRIHEISNDMVSGDTITNLIPEYISLYTKVQGLIKKLDEENLTAYNLNRLRSVRNKLFRYKTRLQSWQEDINSRTEKLSMQRMELSEINSEFAALEQWRGDTVLMSLYKDRLVQIRQEDSLLNQKINNNLKKLVGAQSQLADLKISVNNYMDDLDDAIQNYQISLFNKNSSSLWSKPVGSEQHKLYEQLSAHAETNWPLLISYLNENHVSAYAQISVLVFLSLFFFATKKKAEKLNTRSKLPQLEKVLYVLKYPWSVALLVILIMGPLLYLHPPIILMQIFFILLLIPLLVIIKGRKDTGEMISAVLLCFAFVLAEIEGTQLESSLNHRILILLNSAIAMSSIVIFLRQERTHRGEYPAFFSRMLYLFLGIFSIAVLANLLGYVALSGMLNLATIQSLIFGILLFFGYRIFSILILLITYSKSLQRSRMMKENQEVISKNLSNITSTAILLYWLILTLASFNVYDLTYKIVSGFLLTERAIGSVTFSYWSIIVFILVIWASVTISRLIRYFLEQQYQLSSSSVNNKKGAYVLLLRYFVLVLGFILAVVAAGIPIDKVTIILGALSVGIGFGLQNIVNNLVSGFILALERPIQIGDIVEVSNYMGVVKDIGIRSSTIKTFDGSEVIVPNANFISGEVTNWTLSDKHYRIEILLGVAYGNDSQKVIKVLKKAVEQHDEIMTVPEPMVLFQGFGDSSLNFRILFWCKNRDNWVILRSEVMEKIYRLLKEAKIEIPFPQRDLHIKTDMLKSNGHSKVDHAPNEPGITAPEKSNKILKGKSKLN